MIEIPCVFIIMAFSQVEAHVEVEEIVATCEPPGNGAGPFWCYGSPLIFRWKDDVFVSAMETGEDVPLLCNTRWRIFRKHGNEDWVLMAVNDDFNQREPCPLVGFRDGRIFLSVNPSTQPKGTKYGNCDPHLLEFSAKSPRNSGLPSVPAWEGEYVFTDHSYRGIAADGEQGEILLLNIHAQTGEQLWSFRNSKGEWTGNGRIKFPIRSCYPQVCLKDKAGHVMAIGDIVEPKEEWRKYKHEKTGRDWDYVFRRLFYTWNPDVTKRDFSEPVEIENLDETAGHISNLDMWIDKDGKAHILYLKRSVQSELMRERFFPEVPMQVSLEYAVLQEGKIINRDTLFKGGEGASELMPGYSRFHIDANGNLWIMYYCSGKDEDGIQVSENRLLKLFPEKSEKPVSIGFQHPFGSFFTAIQRGGSVPSDVIDIFGPGSKPKELKYARVRIK
ncbi:hypothetical protein GF312_07920 [Candidatus Poribacteria bacterium]|nr:hypothetical protein [Candidatus Poribacteria bacterium]